MAEDEEEQATLLQRTRDLFQKNFDKVELHLFPTHSRGTSIGEEAHWTLLATHAPTKTLR